MLRNIIVIPLMFVKWDAIWNLRVMKTDSLFYFNVPFSSSVYKVGGQGRGEKLILSSLYKWCMTLYCFHVTVLSSLQTHEGNVIFCISELKGKRCCQRSHITRGRARVLTKVFPTKAYSASQASQVNRYIPKSCPVFSHNAWPSSVQLALK